MTELKPEGTLYKVAWNSEVDPYTLKSFAFSFDDIMYFFSRADAEKGGGDIEEVYPEVTNS